MDQLTFPHDLAFLVMLRSGSERVKNKHFQMIGIKTLWERTSAIIRRASELTGIPVIMAIGEDDKKYQIPGTEDFVVFIRDKRSTNNDDFVDMYHDQFLSELQQITKRVICVNPCLPFVETDVLVDAVLAAQEYHDMCCWSVFTHSGQMWDSAGNTMLDIVMANTKVDEEIFLQNHIYWIITIADLRKNRTQFFPPMKPILVPKTLRNIIDIDTPEDLSLARLVAPLLDANKSNV